MSYPSLPGSGEPLIPPQDQPIPQQPVQAPFPQAPYQQAPVPQVPYQPAPYQQAPYQQAPYQQAPHQPYGVPPQQGQYQQVPYQQAPHQPYGVPPQQAPFQAYGAPRAVLPVAYKDSTAAWLLWFFLGSFGAHHFYLGRTQWGVAYAVGFVVSWILAFVVIGFLGLIALFVLWIIDATKMTERLQQYNAQAFATNRSMGFA